LRRISIGGSSTTSAPDAAGRARHRIDFLARFDLTITGDNDETWSESYEVFDVGADIVITDPTESSSV
jgi:hypothetical protein